MKRLLNNITSIFKEFGALIYIIISLLIVFGMISYNNYLIEQQILLEEELQQSLYEELTKHSIIYDSLSSIDKADLIKIEEQINGFLCRDSNVEYIHIYTLNNKIIYEITIAEVSEEQLKKLSVIYINNINSLCTDIKNIWKKYGLNIDIEVDLLDYENTERTLLASENSQITFNALDKPEKEGTIQDWTNLFYYEKNRYPESEQELEQFKNKKNSDLQKYKGL